ncbi:MAG: excinuclease ABC subunit C [Chloroflexi bacterium RIFCSPLOWO2_12_FULL_71_12]|nr:MAG: excinuclease ABC subunit C [Chloroflexi bacterium GWC2_70_10]OGO72390.1 MAG: excinuclease ABC subunit C [Chloroflexi bacterium RIFCSPLOWO2_12_FULL_71_12]
MTKPSRDSVAALAASLPALPGVYLFKDGRGRVLYVGKADVLRDRVRSYFGPSLDVRHVRMVERAERIDHVITGSIAEAYLLEANLIKQHRPRYNIRLKDDKSYPYVKVTLGEDFPRILRTRQLGDRNARYFGPYANAKAVDDTLDLLQKLFPYRTCKLNIVAGDDGRGSTVPPSALPGGRPCLLYHLKRCTAPCVGNVTAAEYRATVERSVLFLEGRYEPLARELKDEMRASSDGLDFERAAELRDRLRAIERTVERQEVHAYAGDDLDVFGVAVDGGDAAVQIFRVRDGKIVGRDHFFLEGTEGAPTGEVLASFLRQYYSWTVSGEGGSDGGAASPIPPEISSLVEVAEAADLAAFAEARRGGRVRLLVPQRGKKRRLAELAMQNAEDALRQERVRWLADRGKTDEALRELHLALRDHLEIEGPPKRIECYDVSHVQGTDVVSSMVVFEDGRPAKDQYRRFRAKLSDRNDDFANMRDTIRRRFGRQAREGDGKDAWPLPDLLVVDGGKGQLNAARAALSDLGLLQVPVVALAKEKRLASDNGTRVKPEEVFVPERSDPVPLAAGSPGYHLLQRVRDEAHRFAVTYHQKVRSRRAVRSVLDDVEGVGPARKRALLRQFGSVRGIREASSEQVAAVAGVGKALAERIKAAL